MKGDERIDETNPLSEIIKNNQILAVLHSSSSATLSNVADEINVSTSTANRRLNKLRELGLIKIHNDGRRHIYELTTFGETIVAWLYAGNAIWESQRLYTTLSSGASIPRWVITEGTVKLVSEEDVIEEVVFDQVFDVFDRASHLSFVAPTLARGETFLQIVNHVLSDGLTVEIIVTTTVLDLIQSRYSDQIKEIFSNRDNQLFILPEEINVPYSFGVGYTKSIEDDITDAELAMICYDDQDQTALGTIVNQTPSAVAWAQEQYDSYKRQATDYEDDFIINGSEFIFPRKEEK